MELGSAYNVIWYDLYIGQKGQYNAMKMDFYLKLVQTAALPPDRHDPEMDGRALQTRYNNPPITFFDNEEQTLEALEASTKSRKVYFITSGTLGKIIIPEILERKLPVYAYYIFCGKISEHREWLQECVEEKLNIKPFDFETDLLIRLARDMSRELIREGEKLLNLGHPQSALKYLEYARMIAEEANNVEKERCKDPHTPSIEHRRILDGEKGLIAQAKRLCPTPPK